MVAYDFGNVLSNPVFLGSLGLGYVGFVVAFAGSIASEAAAFTWFVNVYNLVLLSFGLVLMLTNNVRNYRQSFLAFLAANLVLTAEQTNIWINLEVSKAQAVGAGHIFLVIVTFVWIIIFGSEANSQVNSMVGGMTMKGVQHNGIVPATIAAGPPIAMANTNADSHLSQVVVSPNAQYAYKAKALYDYTANEEDPNEISFSKNDILDIVDNKGKWWQARKADGTIGIAPSNYLLII